MSRVAVLEGGRSLERQVSLKSSARAQDALERLGHEVIAIDVASDLVSRLRDASPDVAFIALHGRDGEDGTVQELLEILGIPYTASGVAACMLCWDKVLAKSMFRRAGIPTPDWHAFSETAFKELGAAAALPAIERQLGFPLVVKPAGQGSALGVTIVTDATQLPGALVTAFSYNPKVLLERFIAGRELAVAILEGPEPLPIVEAVLNGPYDFSARYEIGRTSFVCPAALDAAATDAVHDAAVAAYEALGCYGFARVDVMLGEDGPQVLEVNAIPGLTDTSLLPQAADAAGIDFDTLIARVLESALAR